MTASAGGPEVHQWGTAPDFQGPRHDLRESLLLDALLATEPGLRVLDVGAGSGTFRHQPIVGEGLRRHEHRCYGRGARSPARARLGGGAAGRCASLPRLLVRVVRCGGPRGGVGAPRGRRRRAVGGCARAAAQGVLAESACRGTRPGSRQSDRWAGHVRRYTREELVARAAAARSRSSRAGRGGSRSRPSSTGPCSRWTRGARKATRKHRETARGEPAPRGVASSRPALRRPRPPSARPHPASRAGEVAAPEI